MTSHELARKLLEMPDVLTGFYSEYGFEVVGDVTSQSDVKPYGYNSPTEPLVIVIGV